MAERIMNKNKKLKKAKEDKYDNVKKKIFDYIDSFINKDWKYFLIILSIPAIPIMIKAFIGLGSTITFSNIYFVFFTIAFSELISDFKSFYYYSKLKSSDENKISIEFFTEHYRKFFILIFIVIFGSIGFAVKDYVILDIKPYDIIFLLLLSLGTLCALSMKTDAIAYNAYETEETEIKDNLNIKEGE